jgi:hypothetical protein
VPSLTADYLALVAYQARSQYFAVVVQAGFADSGTGETIGLDRLVRKNRCALSKNRTVPTPLLCDLDFNMQVVDAEMFDCLADLRIGKDEFEHAGYTYTISIGRALLAMDFSGYEVLPRSRYGEPIQENVLKVDVKFQKEKGLSAATNVETGAKTKIGGMNPELDVTASADALVAANSDQNVTINSETQTLVYAVKAKGGDYWEVTEPRPDGTFLPLDRTFLNGDKLCGLNLLPLQNHRQVGGVVRVRARDIEVHSVGASKSPSVWNLLPKNKQKVLKALIAKKLSNLSNPENAYKGTIDIAQVEIEHEEP